MSRYYSHSLCLILGHFKAKYPELEAKIKARLLAMRKSGLPLDLVTIRGLMVAFITQDAPDLFSQRSKDGKAFRCSESFVRHFLRTHLNWSIRKATRAAQKIPNDVDRILRHAFLRLACTIRDESIDSCFIVNSDQTQVVYAQGSSVTWTEKGSKQVEVVGNDEKRAFTLLVGVSVSGELLPFQAVYQGKDRKRSLPKMDSPGYARAIELGFRFEVSGNGTYWSTHQTMQDYVTFILAPYFEKHRKRLSLPDQRCVWQIDCWSVHRSAEFRDWMRSNYPWILLQYVPGGCTGLFQACDVGMQRILKLGIKRACHADIVNETLGHLANGSTGEGIVLDKTIGTLRDRSVRWILAGFDAVNNPDLVLKVRRSSVSLLLSLL